MTPADSIGAAVVQTAVLPLAALIGVDDERSLPRRLADALIEIANHALDLGVVPGKAASDRIFSSPHRSRR